MTARIATAPLVLRVLLALLALLLLALLAGCEELDEFRTRPGEVFHGRVVGSDSEQDVPSFIRSGFPSFTEMDLTFDPLLASSAGADDPDRPPPPAGALDTYVCTEQEPPCRQSARRPGHFRAAPLEPIARLAHDALSEYDFPGGGRLRNYMLSARFRTDSQAGVLDRAAMVFLSLMESGAIEARVIAPSERNGEIELAPALFGVFVLERRSQ